MAGPIESPTLQAIGRWPWGSLVPFTIGNEKVLARRFVKLAATNGATYTFPAGQDWRRVSQKIWTRAADDGANRTEAHKIRTVELVVGVVIDTVDPSASGRNVPSDTRDPGISSRSYDDVTVQMAGIAIVEAGAVINVGELITCDWAGRAIAQEAWGADLGNAQGRKCNLGIALSATKNTNGGKGTTPPSGGAEASDDWKGDYIYVLLDRGRR